MPLEYAVIIFLLCCHLNLSSSYDTLGAAGHPVVKTPRLDQLAQEGVLFSHNCVTTSVCWCSRANLYTGMYTTRHGTNRPRDWIMPWNITIYDILQQAGYYVGHAGKWGIWIPEEQNGKIHFNVEEDGWHIAPRGDGFIQITEKNEEDALRFLRTRDKDKPFFINVAFYATHVSFCLALFISFVEWLPSIVISHYYSLMSLLDI
jgi:arylsulfatase